MHLIQHAEAGRYRQAWSLLDEGLRALPRSLRLHSLGAHMAIRSGDGERASSLAEGLDEQSCAREVLDMVKDRTGKQPQSRAGGVPSLVAASILMELGRLEAAKRELDRYVETPCDLHLMGVISAESGYLELAARGLINGDVQARLRDKLAGRDPYGVFILRAAGTLSVPGGRGLASEAGLSSQEPGEPGTVKHLASTLWLARTGAHAAAIDRLPAILDREPVLRDLEVVVECLTRPIWYRMLGTGRAPIAREKVEPLARRLSETIFSRYLEAVLAEDFEKAGHAARDLHHNERPLEFWALSAIWGARLEGDREAEAAWEERLRWLIRHQGFGHWAFEHLDPAPRRPAQ